MPELDITQLGDVWVTTRFGEKGIHSKNLSFDAKALIQRLEEASKALGITVEAVRAKIDSGEKVIWE